MHILHLPYYIELAAGLPHSTYNSSMSRTIFPLCSSHPGPGHTECPVNAETSVIQYSTNLIPAISLRSGNNSSDFTDKDPEVQEVKYSGSKSQN